MPLPWRKIAIVGSFCSHHLLADNWFLENRPYFDPLAAEVRAAHTQIHFPSWSRGFQFAVNPGSHLAWDINLGKEFPIAGWESSPADDPTGVPAGHWGIGVWFPISFHMVEDMNKDDSNPILNTDYRFSGMVKGQFGLRRWGKAHLGFRAQFGHESTHLGDEFTAAAIRVHPTAFQRVNVSYEYLDLGFSLEPNFGRDNRQHLKLRAGYVNEMSISGKNSWYSPDLLYPYGVTIQKSRRNYDIYTGAEFYAEPDRRRNGLFASTEVRFRTVYRYTVEPQAGSESVRPSVNFLIGLREKPRTSGNLARFQPTYYGRFYYGVNPHGQFRNDRNYSLFAFGIQFGF